jgi:hypothetical protein
MQISEVYKTLLLISQKNIPGEQMFRILNISLITNEHGANNCQMQLKESVA